MKILYRISSNSYKKDKLPLAKEQYFDNLISNINKFKSFQSTDSEIILFCNNLDDSLNYFCNSINKIYPNIPIKTFFGTLNNAQSFLEVFEYALKNFKDDEIVYFLEDDYYHRMDKDIIKHIIVALNENIADYISLYDHPDKYIIQSKGGNPLVDDEHSGEKTIVKLDSLNQHWKLTNSTTMTFATKISTLKKDRDIFLSYLYPGVSHPNDFHIFLDLISIQKSTVATPIPGLSTHGETNYLSPGFKELIENEKEIQ